MKLIAHVQGLGYSTSRMSVLTGTNISALKVLVEVLGKELSASLLERIGCSGPFARAAVADAACQLRWSIDQKELLRTQQELASQVTPFWSFAKSFPGAVEARAIRARMDLSEPTFPSAVLGRLFGLAAWPEDIPLLGRIEFIDETRANLVVCRSLVGPDVESAIGLLLGAYGLQMSMEFFKLPKVIELPLKMDHANPIHEQICAIAQCLDLVHDDGQAFATWWAHGAVPEFGVSI